MSKNQAVRGLKINAMEKIISEIFNSLAAIGHQEDLEKYKGLVDSIEVPKDYDVFRFDRDFLKPLRKFAEVFIKLKISDNKDVVEIISNHRYYVSHFEFWIQSIEGSACCHDKSSTLVDMLITYYRKNEPMAFDYDGNYSFCYPKQIFNTEEKVVKFYEALKQLRHGNSYLYIEAVAPMIEIFNKKNDDLVQKLIKF